MKNILKSFFVFALILSFTSCDTDGDTTTSIVKEDSGWVQFLSANSVNATQVTDSELTLDVNIQVPKTSSALAINYDLIPVSGLNPNSVFSNDGTTVAPAGSTSWAGPDNNTASDYAYLAPITFDLTQLPLLTENMVFDVVLTSTNSANITVGLNDEKPVMRRVIICSAFLNTFSYTGDSFTLDLGIGGGELVAPYDVTLEPVAGVCGTWSMDTSWGPDFVSTLCGGCVAPGSFPNPSTIVINADNTITVTGDNGDGTGTYDPLTGTIVLNIAQTLFTGSFTVDVVLTAN